ncbi:zinc finger protein 362a isoform X3 [Betta splendens]|uniref:Zinc finger protein 362a isoform X3 n=2 Tax=Betta splendens TaxID=158456 RepID=A0A9W2XS52_BETSP|nr:zinc finger protein 362a isoform X3 [Betta splendens]
MHLQRNVFRRKPRLQRRTDGRMAEPRFNNPYFWPPPTAMPGQEQLMAEKIRPHLPPASAPSQQPLLAAPGQTESGQHGASKAQQMQVLHGHSPSQPDIALHARPASSSVSGRILGDVNLNLDDKSAVKARGLWEDWHLRQLMDNPSRANHVSGVALASRTGNLSASEVNAPTTPAPGSQSRLGRAPAPHLVSGLASCHGMEPGKPGAGLMGLLGPPPKQERGRKKIKAENGSSLFVVPYPILASGTDQSCVTITAKEGKTYRCKICPLTFFSKSDMQIHSKTHTEAKAHKCPHCTKSFTNASYLAQHLRIHLGVKPYRCSYCEKSFRQLSHLQQHTRIHTGDRPYRCSHAGCEKAFTQLSNLQSHQRQHNKDKPFKCSNCYRAYGDSASLQIHLSAHAIKNAKAYCCSLCGRVYTSVSAPQPGPGAEPRRPCVTAPPVLCVCVSPGNVPHEAHGETHGGGARGVPSLAPAQDRVALPSYTHLPHLRPGLWRRTGGIAKKRRF